MRRHWYDWHKIQPWLKKKLSEPGVSQAKIAKGIGISGTLISLAKSGQRSLSPAKTHQLIRALGYGPVSVLRSLGIKPHTGPLLDNSAFTILMGQLEADNLIVLSRPGISKLQTVIGETERSVRGRRYLTEKILRRVFEDQLLAALGRNR
ncbi:MAG: helix-turn-helix transcriptional regulator [bacterium]